MAGAVKGITIEFRGETTKLQSAINTLRKESKGLDNEMKAINRSLKFNPKSVDLWKQKQTVLNQSIKETDARLQELKKARDQLDSQSVDRTSAEYRELEREIIKNENIQKRLNAELRAIPSAQVRALGEAFKETGQKMKDAGSYMTQHFSAPIAAGFAASTKLALDFDDAMAKVSTIADQSQVPIADLRSGIMDLSNESGKGSQELAEAAYQALSASVETKDVVGFLKDATGLAKAGFLDTADSVDVLTTIMNAYGYSAEDAEKIASQLIQTQNDGKTTVNELAGAMGQVIPTASALNIPLEQLNASYVILTKQGINTANSTTYLNGMFTELADGGSTVSQILQDKTGKTFGQLMKDGYTLGDVMGILNESVDGDSEAFLNLWGNTRAGKGALALLNGGVEEFNAEADKMYDASGNVATALENLDTPGAHARKALNELKNAAIEIGDRLTPVVQTIADFATQLIEKWDALSPQTQNIILAIAGIVAAVGPLLLILGTVVTSIGNLLIFGPMIIGAISGVVGAIGGILAVAGPVILVIGSLIAAGVMLYKNWDAVKAWAVSTWGSIKSTISNTVTSIKATVVSVFSAVKATVASIWDGIKTAITTPITNAYNTLSGIVKKIKGLFPLSVGKIFSNLKIPEIHVSGGKAPFGIGGKGKKPSISVSWHAQGGIFDRPTLLTDSRGGVHGLGEHGAEAIMPLDPLWNKLDRIAEATATAGDITVNVYAGSGDAREIAEEVKRVIIHEVKNRRLAWQ